MFTAEEVGDAVDAETRELQEQRDQLRARVEELEAEPNYDPHEVMEIIKKKRAEEREACIKETERWASLARTAGDTNGWRMASSIAESIQARGTETGSNSAVLSD